MPTFHYQDVTSPQYEEADIIEQWCLDREADGVSASAATVEIDTWLTGDRGPTSPVYVLKIRSRGAPSGATSALIWVGQETRHAAN